MPRTTAPSCVARGRAAIVLIAALSSALLVACSSTGIGTASNGTTTPPEPTTSVPAPSTPAGTSTDSGTSPAAASCSPSGTSLTITAKNIQFSTKCLAAPANTPFTIAFDNEDAGVPHNIDIFSNPSATTSLFKGSTVTGPKTVTDNVPALPAGTYFFRCDIHPTQMTGTFVVS